MSQLLQKRNSFVEVQEPQTSRNPFQKAPELESFKQPTHTPKAGAGESRFS